MNRLSRWHRLFVVAVLVWGVIVYWQTEWPRFPMVHIPIDSQGPALAAEAAQTRRVILNRIGYWLLTSAAAYAVCHGVAWSRRGFSADINHLK